MNSRPRALCLSSNINCPRKESALPRISLRRSALCLWRHVTRLVPPLVGREEENKWSAMSMSMQCPEPPKLKSLEPEPPKWASPTTLVPGMYRSPTFNTGTNYKRCSFITNTVHTVLVCNTVLDRTPVRSWNRCTLVWPGDFCFGGKLFHRAKHGTFA